MGLFISATRHVSMIALGAALAAGALSVPAAVAQSAQAGSEDGPDSRDIIVTAQFRSQRLQDTPLSITAVNAEMLEAREQKSVADLGQFSPNVNISQGSSLYGNALSAFIRGVGQNNANFALEPGVGVYIDDVYYGTTFGAVFDLTDLDRIEVLRGPQGTLAGKNSIGGSLKLFSKLPNATDGGFLQASYGRFNRFDIRGSANFTVAEGLYARISGVAKGSDGYMKRLDYGCANPGEGVAAESSTLGNCKVGTEGGSDVLALRAALRYAPEGSPLEVNLVADVARDNSEQVATKLMYADNAGMRTYDPGNPAGGVPLDSRFITGSKSYTTYADYCNSGNITTAFGFDYPQAKTVCASPKSTSKSWGLAGTIDYDLGDSLSLKSITAYREAKGFSGVDADGSPINVLLEFLNLSHKQFTQELRLSGKVGSLLDFTVGGFYYNAKDRQSLRIIIPNVMFDFLSDDPVKNVSKSAFVHAELHPFENFNIIGGLRYTHDRKTYTFARRNPDGSLPTAGPFVAASGGTYPSSWVATSLGGGLDLVFPQNGLLAGLDGLSQTYSKGQVDWRIGVNYRWSPAFMTYAQVSTGFKGGGINPMPYVADQVRTFDPEEVTAYEVGFKADLLDRKLRINGAAFFNDYKNMQMTLYYCAVSATPSPCALVANAGDAHVKGAELELFLEPVPGLTIDGNVGYLDFQYQSVSSETGVSRDMKAPFNGKWQSSAGIQYQAELAGGATLTPRLDWDYRSSFFNNAINRTENRVPARSLFNARLTYMSADTDWSISAGVTNIFDKFYYNAINENMASYGMSTGVVGRPREWSLTVKRKF